MKKKLLWKINQQFFLNLKDNFQKDIEVIKMEFNNLLSLERK